MDCNDRPVILLYLLFPQGKIGDKWYIKITFDHGSCIIISDNLLKKAEDRLSATDVALNKSEPSNT